MQTALYICELLASVIGFLFAYRMIFLVLGIFGTKKYEPAKKQHRYAVLVAARNEETVIGNLLDSIAEQDYPAELLTVFVVADNCTDKTAEIARSKGAICHERFDTEHCTKGYALEFLFEHIERDYGIESFDGYFLFDADNLLRRDFISRMNDAFDSGEDVVVSYRNTKNLGDGWLSASYALHWLRTCRLEHCGRSLLGISGRIQGTGFVFSSKYVRDGWHYVSLTEDRAFSSDVLVQGGRIAYQHEAQFYDEQPNRFRVACRQRLRWAKGHLQAFTETARALFCGIFRRGSVALRVSCYDMLTTNLPLSILTVPIKLAEAGLIVTLCVTSGNLSQQWFSLLLQVLGILVFEHFGNIGMAIIVFFLERKRMRRLRWYQYVWYAVTFPMFTIIGDVATILAVFTKVTWKPIPHNANVRIEELEGECPQEERELIGSQSEKS